MPIAGATFQSRLNIWLPYNKRSLPIYLYIILYLTYLFSYSRVSRSSAGRLCTCLFFCLAYCVSWHGNCFKAVVSLSCRLFGLLFNTAIWLCMGCLWMANSNAFSIGIMIHDANSWKQIYSLRMFYSSKLLTMKVCFPYLDDCTDYRVKTPEFGRYLCSDSQSTFLCVRHRALLFSLRNDINVGCAATEAAYVKWMTLLTVDLAVVVTKWNGPKT